MKIGVSELWNALTAACVLVLTVVVVNRTGGSGSDTTPIGQGGVAAVDSTLWGELVQSRLAFGKVGGIEIVEFSDFECPACRGFSERVIQRLKRDSLPDVRFSFRHYPLSYHRFALPAARAAECAAEQNRFWEMHDALFSAVDSFGLTPFENVARTARVPNLEAFSECIAAPRTDSLVKHDMELGRRISIGKTPTIVINGEVLESTPTLEQLMARIEAYRRADPSK